jgi:PAS domain-containing protein
MGGQRGARAAARRAAEGRYWRRLFCERSARAGSARNPGWRRPASGAGAACSSVGGVEMAVEVRARPLPAACRHRRRHLRVRRAARRQQAGERAARRWSRPCSNMRRSASSSPCRTMVKSCNPRMARMLGYEPRELVGRDPAEFFMSRAAVRGFHRAGDRGADRRRTVRAGRDPAAPPRRHADLVPHPRQGGRHESREAGTIWILEDVTEARQALIEVQAIMTNASIGIFFTRDRVITRANSCFDRMFGYEEGERSAADPRPVRRRAGLRELGRWPTACSGRASPSRPRHMVRKDGTPMWVNLIGYAVNREEPGRARSG